MLEIEHDDYLNGLFNREDDYTLSFEIMLKLAATLKDNIPNLTFIYESIANRLENIRCTEILKKIGYSKTYRGLCGRISSYWEREKEKIINMYSTNNTDIDEKEILKRLRYIEKHKEVLFEYAGIFIREDHAVVVDIYRGKDPFSNVSETLSIESTIDIINKIYDIVKARVESKNLYKELKKIDKTYRFYLSKISLVKNWASGFPKEIRQQYYYFGISYLDNLISRGIIEIADVELLKTLNYLINHSDTLETTINDENRTISNNLIASCAINCEYGDIIQYYYSDLDDDYSPNDIETLNQTYEPEKLEFYKYRYLIDIATKKEEEGISL